ncbi:MAG: trigger factor, partial [Acidimicrobiales bacterium]
MKTSVESLEGNKVKVSVEVPETEFESEIDAAFRRLAREVRIPGFRPGKAPRRILEARLGSDAAREEALRHSVPEYYAQAVRDEDVDVIAAPELEITGGADDGPIAFDAVVEVRPVVTVGGYDSLRVTVPGPDPSEEDIEHQIEHLREQFADLQTVDRAAADDDHVRIDIEGTQDDEPVSGLTAEDYLYPVGSGTVVPELDENLRGAKAGDTIEFVAEHPQPDEAPVSFTLAVKEVKEKVLPDADDAWAAEASEFDTL